MGSLAHDEGLQRRCRHVSVQAEDRLVRQVVVSSVSTLGVHGNPKAPNLAWAVASKVSDGLMLLGCSNF